MVTLHLFWWIYFPLMLMDQNIWMFVGIIFQLLGNPRPKKTWRFTSLGHPQQIQWASTPSWSTKCFQPVEKAMRCLWSQVRAMWSWQVLIDYVFFLQHGTYKILYDDLGNMETHRNAMPWATWMTSKVFHKHPFGDTVKSTKVCGKRTNVFHQLGSMLFFSNQTCPQNSEVRCLKNSGCGIMRDPTCWFLGHFTLGQLQVGVWKTDQHRLWAWQAAKVWDAQIFWCYVSLWIQVPS